MNPHLKPLLVLLLFVNFLNAQDAYKKRYIIRDSIKFAQKYYNNKGNSRTEVYYLTLQGKPYIDTIVRQRLNSCKGLKANVKFGGEDSDKLYINPWLMQNRKGQYVDRETIYYYQLKNRQSVKINFRQWSFNALVVPLKMRFGEENTQFVTGANLGAFLGHSWGKTNFLRRKQIGNKQYDSMFTLGGFIGVESLDFTYQDENETDTSVSTAALSTGLGLLYSYQKFTFGVLGGIDLALGEEGSKWEYHTRPWLGLSLGYSLFAF